MAVLSLAVDSSPTSRRRVEFQVPGVPQPQGSTRAFQNSVTKRLIVVSDNKPTLRPWRLDVKTLALEAMLGQSPFQGPVRVEIYFGFTRPAYHYGRRGGQPVLKPAAPHFSSVRPDVDKLARAMLDALKQAQVYSDDSQVARLEVEKVFEDHPGARVIVEEL